MTLREYINFWQETYDKSQSRPTTYAAHNYVFKNHIIPGLGDIPLSELTSEMVEDFLEERRRFGNHRPGSSGLGEETMRHIHRLLQQCLDQAMRDGLIGDNPARAFHYSKPKKVNADVLTPLEMEDYLDAAEKANAPICYIPSQDGQIYEMRRNEIGTFIAPSSKIVELDMVRAGFQMNLPRLPAAKLAEIISFFRRVCTAYDCCMEALVNVYWDRVEQEYILHVPTQQATAVSVETDLSDRPDESRYYLVMEVHSHNMMAARFSRTDDADEQATRLYMVIGRLDRFYPEIRCRFACGGQHIEIPAEQVCERSDVPFSTAWLTAVHAHRREAA